MSIVLTAGQEEMVRLGEAWFKSQEKQVFRAFGYAGTGKTTSINALIRDLGIDPKAVAYATYTGKAALVLLRKGHGATTIHKLIYEPIEVKEKYTDPKDGEIKFRVTIKFRLKDNLPEDIKLLVLDECSMIDERIWNDLLSLNRPIIVLGDPGQLPPINGKSPVTAEKPDIMLTEVMRQAADNPIIYLSTLAREGKRIEYGDYGNGVYVVKRRDLEDYDFLDNDIVIATTNNTRDEINNMMRELKGFRSPLPCVGDKLICRKNDWDTSLNGIPLVNGLIGDVINPVRPNEGNSNLIDVDFRPDGFNKKFFEGIDINLEMLSPTIDAKARREIMGDKYSPGHMFEYGYAITTHLSQGSQWENVLYLYQGFGDATMRKQLLYTGITRAEKGLTLTL